MNSLSKKHGPSDKELALDHSYLLEILHYNPETGVWIQRVATSKRVKVGDIAGGKDSEGYIRIGINGERYQAHRLAWFYIHGVWPKDEIDHANKIKNDNRLVNLREANHSQGMANRSVWRDGLKGVCFHKGKWQAQCKKDGNDYYGGLFNTELEAHEKHMEMARYHHGEFASA